MTLQEATNEAVQEVGLQIKLEDMSLLADMKTYLTISDISDTVHITYGITIVSSPF